MPHLKSHQFYSDLYDRHTVEQCRRTEEHFKKETDPPASEEVNKEEVTRINPLAMQLALHWEAGERYINKEKAIREWMDSARKKDDLLESAQAPEDIRCLTCRSRVQPTFKELWSQLDTPDRVLFMYDCPNKCLPRRAFFSDGEEWRTKPNLCPRCDTVLDQKADDDGKKLITTNTCSKCGYTETDEHEWSFKKEDEVDENFPKDRDRFCLTDEEGRKYQDEKYNMEQLGKIMEEFNAKEKIRAEKLKENPKGFHIEGAGYSCFICGDHTPEGDNWYDEYGIKCLVCQKAIDDGEIPASLAKEKDTWYTKYDLERYFELKGPTLRKWVKDDIIKARTVSHFGKGVHYELFLIEDNKDFLPPKKMVESRSVKERRDGKDWYTTAPWYQFVDPFVHLNGYKIMDYMRIVPPEEMKAREEEKKKKWEEKQARKKVIGSRYAGAKRKRKGNSVRSRERGDAGLRQDRQDLHEPGTADS